MFLGARRRFPLLIVLLLFTLKPLRAETSDAKFEKEACRKSPSFDLKKWTGTQASYESYLEYDYVGQASTNLGNGHNRPIDENYLDVRHQFVRHTLLAFLVQIGIEYQHLGFGVPNDALIPDRLDSLVSNIALDTRWSENDLLHFQWHPGLYTDFRGSGGDAFHTPMDVGYTHVSSRRFQWIVGFSYNRWRSTPFLGAAGFRWQITPRWKLKLYLPTPDIEFAARPDLTLLLGADVRGDSYRVGPHFGDSKGIPKLNNAFVDYQEVRVGPGFSWNVRPLIEVNLMAGYMVGRQYNFHDSDIKLNGSGAPFVNLTIHALFKLPGEPLRILQRNQMSFGDLFKYF